MEWLLRCNILIPLRLVLAQHLNRSFADPHFRDTNSEIQERKNGVNKGPMNQLRKKERENHTTTSLSITSNLSSSTSFQKSQISGAKNPKAQSQSQGAISSPSITPRRTKNRSTAQHTIHTYALNTGSLNVNTNTLKSIPIPHRSRTRTY